MYYSAPGFYSKHFPINHETLVLDNTYTLNYELILEKNLSYSTLYFRNKVSLVVSKFY